jgi:hypothetical protein
VIIVVLTRSAAIGSCVFTAHEKRPVWTQSEAGEEFPHDGGHVRLRTDHWHSL